MPIGIGIAFGVKLAFLLKAALATTVVVAAVSVLTWERIRTWFEAHAEIHAQDKDNIAFSLVEKINAEEFKTVYGIFNQRTGKVAAAEAVQSASLDETLRTHHGREPLVVYR